MIIWHGLVAAHDWLNKQYFLVAVLSALLWYWLGYRDGKKAGKK